MTPHKTEKIAYRERDFHLYVLWRSIPAFLLADITEILGPATSEMIKHEPIAEVLNIRTAKKFAEKYGINKNTLTYWNKKIEKEGLVEQNKREWGKHLTANLIGSLYKWAMREGDANRIKLWLQWFEGFADKSEMDLGEKTRKQLASLQESIASIAKGGRK